MGTTGLSIAPINLVHKQIELIEAQAVDIETIAVAPGEYVEWYRFEISTGSATTAVELRASIIIGDLAVSAILISHTAANHLGGINVLEPPVGGAIRAQEGEDLQVVIDNLDRNTDSSIVDWNLYYMINKPRPV